MSFSNEFGNRVNVGTTPTSAAGTKPILPVGVKTREGKREPNAFSADPQEPLSLLQTAGPA